MSHSLAKDWFQLAVSTLKCEDLFLFSGWCIKYFDFGGVVAEQFKYPLAFWKHFVTLYRLHN